MKAKDYLQTLGIQDETIYDNAERMHSLECLLDDFLQENQAKNNEVLDLVSKRFELKAKIKIIGNTSSHGFEIDEIVTAIDFEAKYNQWVCEGNSGKRWYINEDEGTVC